MFSSVETIMKPLFYPEMETTGSLKFWCLYTHTKLLNTTYQKTIILSSLFVHGIIVIVFLQVKFCSTSKMFISAAWILRLSFMVIRLSCSFLCIKWSCSTFPCCLTFILQILYYVYCFTIFSTLTHYSI
jgi:hypothetical protein